MVKIISFSIKAFQDIDRIIEFNNQRNQSVTYPTKIIKKLFNRFKKNHRKY